MPASNIATDTTLYIGGNNMKPLNRFTDESVMAPYGEPLEYTGKPLFSNVDGTGLVVYEITMEEFELARKIQQEKEDAPQD